MSIFDSNKHYFVLMHSLEFGIYKSSNSRETFVECVIDETEYKLEEDYKVTFRALDTRYGTETYYLNTAEYLLEKGFIVPAEGKSVKEITWAEPLTDKVNVIHSAYVVE